MDKKLYLGMAFILLVIVICVMVNNCNSVEPFIEGQQDRYSKSNINKHGVLLKNIAGDITDTNLSKDTLKGILYNKEFTDAKINGVIKSKSNFSTLNKLLEETYDMYSNGIYKTLKYTGIGDGPFASAMKQELGILNFLLNL